MTVKTIFQISAWKVSNLLLKTEYIYYENLTDFHKTVETSMDPRLRQVDLRDFERQERICTSVKDNAEHFLQFVRLLSGKQR